MNQLNSKKWFAVDIEVDAAAAEAIEYAFNTLDALGSEIDNLRKSAGDNVKVTGYFNDLPDDEDLNDEIDSALDIYSLTRASVRSITSRPVEEIDWLVEWKRHWKPTQIGKFIIAPAWSEVSAKNKIVIRIEPNRAFGTGTHETTQLCLQAIGNNYRDDQTFLDVGTGTGILAIAVAKLTAEATAKRKKLFVNSVPSVANIFACDTDADSVKIAKGNADANGVGDRIDFFEGTVSVATPAYDFVCANLTIDVISPLLPLLIEKSESILLLSGILTEQEAQIKGELLKLGVAAAEIERSGEWISVFIRFS
ncbi:MAG: 50S ribosomal protein L11 methyltransferase [Pyrinomonadaceae bacterium]